MKNTGLRQLLKSSLALLILISQPSFAGSAVSVTITKLGTGPYYESVCGKACIAIQVSPQHTNHASCAQNITSWDFALDTSTEGGKQAYSHLLAAHLSSRQISIYGKGTCIGTGNYEEIDFVITD